MSTRDGGRRQPASIRDRSSGTRRSKPAAPFHDGPGAHEDTIAPFLPVVTGFPAPMRFAAPGLPQSPDTPEDPVEGVSSHAQRQATYRPPAHPDRGARRLRVLRTRRPHLLGDLPGRPQRRTARRPARPHALAGRRRGAALPDRGRPEQPVGIRRGRRGMGAGRSGHRGRRGLRLPDPQPGRRAARRVPGPGAPEPLPDLRARRRPRREAASRPGRGTGVEPQARQPLLHPGDGLARTGRDRPPSTSSSTRRYPRCRCRPSPST